MIAVRVATFFFDVELLLLQNSQDTSTSRQHWFDSTSLALTAFVYQTIGEGDRRPVRLQF
jgi:hypothetical protein